MDVKFVVERYNKKTRAYFFDVLEVMGTHLPAGIQVKAITGNERSEIIDPLISGRYSRVLTYLKHADGIHSYYECMRILQQLYKAGQIGAEERQRVSDSIKAPEHLGLDQHEVEEYYRYVKQAHKGTTRAEDIIWRGAELEVKYHKGVGGILVPDSLGGVADGQVDDGILT